MSYNNFNKQLLTKYIESECKRQLFLELAYIMPEKWYTDERKIERPKHIHKMHKLLLDFGKDYEKKVYEYLRSIKGACYNLDAEGNVDETYLNPSLFAQLYENLKKSQLDDFILLEYQYEIPETFFYDIFPPKGTDKAIPVNYGEQRPDIMIIGNSFNKHNNTVLELISDGTVREVPENELYTRYGINIIDIKNIREDHIGKKQFIEILYYLLTLASYLKEYKLDDKFFVRIDFNGIFPQYNTEDLKKLQNINDIIEMLIQVHWNESLQIFTDTINKIGKLWSTCPIPIESTSVNIQPSCGYCFFLEDCKNTLGMDNFKEPKDWSLKLLPYTSSSTSQQLIDLGFQTIEDVANNINSIPIGSTPNPLYSEIPLLQNKSLALINDRDVLPRPGHTHTYAIPKFSPISITFAVEKAPNIEKVYAAGFFLQMYTFANSYFSNVFDNWWKTWKDAIKLDKKPEDIQKILNEFMVREISLEEIEEFKYILKKLKIDENLISLRGEIAKSGNPRKQTRVILQFATINEGSNNETEGKFTKNIIKTLYYILELTNYIEKFVIVVADNSKSGYVRYYGPTTSLFYWGERQLNNFQDMLERNLIYIIDDVEVWGRFLRIIELFTPSDSEVSHPYQHKKLFNLQNFTETILGFPSIINYTWHEIAKRALSTYSSSKYWIPHFNYMDFNNWYEMILNKDLKERKEIREEIRRQIMHKIRTINNLRINYQIQSKYVISKHARTFSREELRRIAIPPEYHSIAHVWYIFSKLTGSRDERDAEYFRTIYPELSIGKLAAAKVSELKIHMNNEKFYYSFQIKNLSSNMKINIGDRVLLIPDENRDMRSNQRMNDWKVTISSMVWSSEINGYLIQTEENRKKLLEKLDISKKLEQFSWYLYNTALDVWSNKLYKDNGLLQRHNLGNTWLGARLAYLWKIRSKQVLKWPQKWSFTAPSVYLFAPELLNPDTDNNFINIPNDLLTPIEPIPDHSQRKAINLALNEIISGIQGPPGTGKSQTIAALIDEYYIRSEKNGKDSVKILVSAFSYAAIRVLIEKIRSSKDKDGNPTISSQLQMIFLKSKRQEKIEGILNLTRYSKDTWKINDENFSVIISKPLKETLNDNFIMFANAHQLFHLTENPEKLIDEDFAFDLICVDEASQLPVDNFMSSLQFIHNKEFKFVKPQFAREPGTRVTNTDEVKSLELKEKIDKDSLTKVVIVGDFNQLPPVQPVPPPKKLEKVLESLFTYYVKHHKIPNTQLQVNYRSHKDIVGFTETLGMYNELIPYSETAERTLEGNISNVEEDWVQEVLNPKKVVSAIIHKKKRFEIGVSVLEAEIVIKIVVGYYEMKHPQSEEEERMFWREDIGVVAPHNAQGRLIIRRVFDELTNSKKPKTNLTSSELMYLLKSTIYSVEKFQGSDRELIISSIGISDKDQLNSESEFIYDINRFNVLTSRAKCKVILVASEKFLKFIPEERIIMEEAARIHKYAYKYCNKSQTLTIKDEKDLDENVEFRYKE